MEKLKLEGFYLYNRAPTGKGKLTGEIEVARDGTFEGIIYDHISRVPEQTVFGKIHSEDNLDKIYFVKIPPLRTLANVLYRLEKKSSGYSEGKYLGAWRVLPFKTEFNEDLGIYLSRVDPSLSGIGDSAEINLYKE